MLDTERSNEGTERSNESERNTDREPSTDRGVGADTGSSADAGAPTATAVTRRRRSASRPAGPPNPSQSSATQANAPDAAPEPTPVKRTRKRAAPAVDGSADGSTAAESPVVAAEPGPAAEKAAAPARRRRKAAAAPTAEAAAEQTPSSAVADGSVPALVFQPPPAQSAPARRRSATKSAESEESGSSADDAADLADPDQPDAAEGDDAAPRSGRRRRGRRGRGGRGAAAASDAETDAQDGGLSGDEALDAEGADDGAAESDEAGAGSAGTRRRRRRRRSSGSDGAGTDASPDDPPNTVVHVREPRKQTSDDGVRGVKGSTRIEAKRQRRRDGRDPGRRRASIITEAEFLARREAVDRVMVVRQAAERTQIAVLEDGVLVEHYVTKKDQASMVGNVYLGKVQNVLPSMEAAFVDIGRGRNAVLYAGEVNYDASALEGRPPRIEQALKSGQSVLVQVTKDPIGHKGGRLTSQVSLPGRYMVYVPDGRLSGISRKLPDTERSRLKGILKRLTPEDAGVIIRTAAEGATEEALERDLNRLKAQWEVIETKSKTASAPSLIYGEPDLVIRVVRDIFNEDFSALVVQGEDEWETIDNYVRWVAPDLAERATRWTEDEDVFSSYRVDEQLAKALERKVWLPSGGYLVIDRTEAMVVVDVNTGKFTGKGGNLEETVTKNNLEAAEEIVRQLRLRDLGGIIVIDFIDMVLESNRDLVLRRLLECLGRDRTRHQVAEVTSLGLVQMTRKRVGSGLLEAFSETCECCNGRG
ncbi:MAG TPA: Rne/Rng family ribonuclease, partial [Mycobacteriales bacterium]|nr:Rne/Rng family ribonuclease [Mycobacteriales bacterium]